MMIASLRSRLVVFLGLLGLIFAAWVIRVFSIPEEPFLELVFASTGSGGVVLIRTGDGQHILIDGGAGQELASVLDRELSIFDRRIDWLIALSDKSVLVAGLDETIGRYAVKEVLLNTVLTKSSTYQTLSSRLRNTGSRVSYFDATTQLRWGKTFLQFVISEPTVSLRLDYGRFSAFLFSKESSGPGTQGKPSHVSLLHWVGEEGKRQSFELSSEVVVMTSPESRASFTAAIGQDLQKDPVVWRVGLGESVWIVSNGKHWWKK